MRTPSTLRISRKRRIIALLGTAGTVAALLVGPVDSAVAAPADQPPAHHEGTQIEQGEVRAVQTRGDVTEMTTWTPAPGVTADQLYRKLKADGVVVVDHGGRAGWRNVVPIAPGGPSKP